MEQTFTANTYDEELDDFIEMPSDKEAILRTIRDMTVIERRIVEVADELGKIRKNSKFSSYSSDAQVSEIDEKTITIKWDEWSHYGGSEIHYFTFPTYYLWEENWQEHAIEEAKSDAQKAADKKAAEEAKYQEDRKKDELRQYAALKAKYEGKEVIL